MGNIEKVGTGQKDHEPSYMVVSRDKNNTYVVKSESPSRESLPKFPYRVAPKLPNAVNSITFFGTIVLFPLLFTIMFFASAPLLVNIGLLLVTLILLGIADHHFLKHRMSFKPMVWGTPETHARTSRLSNNDEEFAKLILPHHFEVEVGTVDYDGREAAKARLLQKIEELWEEFGKLEDNKIMYELRTPLKELLTNMPTTIDTLNYACAKLNDLESSAQIFIDKQRRLEEAAYESAVELEKGQIDASFDYIMSVVEDESKIIS